MARIRTIKPEIWSDEALGACPRDARLLFVGLITQADDEGRFRAAPALLRSSIFPYDESLNSDRVEAWLEDLDHAGVVTIYTVGGQRFGEFPSWSSHQKIDRPSESKLPPIGARDPSPTPDSSNTRRALDEASSLEGKGKERKGKDRESSFVTIYTSWQTQPGLIKHKRPTPAMRRAAATALANHDLDDLLLAIQLYATVITSDKHWFTYSWTLEEFLKRGASKFVPEVNPLTRYFGAQPGSNGKLDKPERDPEASRQRDIAKIRSIYNDAIAEGMSVVDARAEAAGAYSDERVTEAIGAQA